MAATTELFIFMCRRDADAAGFRGCRHPRIPDAIAWWPGAGMANLMGPRFRRVIVDSGILDCRHFREQQIYECRHAAHQLLRSEELFRDQFVWVGPRLPF